MNETPLFAADELFNVDRIVRTVMIEALMIDDDHFAAGNNYFLYYDTSTSRWNVIDHDFDTELAPKHGKPIARNVFAYVADQSMTNGNPVMRQVFDNEKWMKQYATYLMQLTSSSDLTVRLPEVYRDLQRIVAKLVKNDMFFQAATNTTPLAFEAAVNFTLDLLSNRVVESKLAVLAYLSGSSAGSSDEEWLGLKWQVWAGIGAGVVVLLIVVVLTIRRLRTGGRRRRVNSRFPSIMHQETRYL